MKRLLACLLFASLLAGCNDVFLLGGAHQPPTRSLTLEWVYPPRSDNYGFVVFRADRMEGPYTEVTADIIPTIDPMSGQEPKYKFIDEHVLGGQKYYYSIEAVNTITRRKTRILPVQALSASIQKKGQ